MRFTALTLTLKDIKDIGESYNLAYELWSDAPSSSCLVEKAILHKKSALEFCRSLSLLQRLMLQKGLLTTTGGDDETLQWADTSISGSEMEVQKSQHAHIDHLFRTALNSPSLDGEEGASIATEHNIETQDLLHLWDTVRLVSLYREHEKRRRGQRRRQRRTNRGRRTRTRAGSRFRASILELLSLPYVELEDLGETEREERYSIGNSLAAALSGDRLE